MIPAFGGNHEPFDEAVDIIHSWIAVFIEHLWEIGEKYGPQSLLLRHSAYHHH